MIPETLMELPNLRDVLLSRGDKPAAAYKCICKKILPPENFVQTDALGADIPKFVCLTCASHPHRVALAKQAADAAAALPPWETELGIVSKLERDRRINATLWTTTSGSPLSTKNKAAWRAWREQMFRITLDFAEPLAADSPDWPKEPKLVYIGEDDD